MLYKLQILLSVFHSLVKLKSNVLESKLKPNWPPQVNIYLLWQSLFLHRNNENDPHENDPLSWQMRRNVLLHSLEVKWK